MRLRETKSFLFMLVFFSFILLFLALVFWLFPWPPPMGPANEPPYRPLFWCVAASLPTALTGVVSFGLFSHRGNEIRLAWCKQEYPRCLLAVFMATVFCFHFSWFVRDGWGGRIRTVFRGCTGRAYSE